MEGTMTYWTGTPMYYTRDVLYLLLDADGTEFRHSTLWRPSSTELYGDKEVSHRVMRGSIEPIFQSTLPYPWSNTTDWIYYSRDHGSYYNTTYNTYCGGTKFAYSMDVRFLCEYYSKQQYWTVNSVLWTLELEESDKGPVVYFREYLSQIDESTGWYTANPNPMDYKDPKKWGKVYEYLAAEKLNGVWKYYQGKLDVKYDLYSPVPYYWRSYMDEIRPEVNPTALSECIRNAITEATTWDTNNYANLLEIIDTIRDFRNGKIIDLIEDAKELYRTADNLVDTAQNLDVSTIRTGVRDYSSSSNWGKTVKVTGERKWKKNARSIAKSSISGVSDAWLKYRYLYNTTKSDVESYARFKLGEYSGSLTPERVIRGKIDVENGSIHVKMRLHDDTTQVVSGLLVGLNQYGLMPGLYNLWDMIPFSFIADWFSDLGDYLKDFDERVYFNYYKIDELLVTYKQEFSRDELWGTTYYKYYDRTFLEEWPQWEFYEDDSKKSLKTIIYRGLDALSLAVGTKH